jgi:hypothetical protein
MHTDEYEISVGREITLCRKFVERLKHSLGEREKRYKMTTESFLQTLEQGHISEQGDFRSWHEEYHQLRYWQKMLSDYEEALRSLKGI